MLKLNDVSISQLKSQFLSEYQYSGLAKKVLEQIGDDQSVFTYPHDYSDASGGVTGFIYYTDTLKFAKDNIFMILKAVNEYEYECGQLMKPLENETQYYIWLAWFALEMTINDLIRFIEDY